MKYMKAIFEMIGSLLESVPVKEPKSEEKPVVEETPQVKPIEPKLTISAKVPVDGTGNDTDVWMTYKEV